MPFRAFSEEREERRMIIVLYLGTLLLLGFLLFAAYSNMRRYNDAVRSIRHYNYALLELTELLSDLQDQETGTRGYLLTNDTLFLEPYQRVRTTNVDRFNAADSLLTDPDWHALLQVLRIRVETVEEHLAALVTLHGAQPSLDAADVGGLQRSKAAMDELRLTHDRIMDQLRLEREGLLSAERSNSVDAPVMLMLYSALALGATALLFWRLSRSLRSTEGTKLKLQEKLVELDKEVKHRSSVQGMLQKVLDTSPSGTMVFRSLHDGAGTLIDFEFRAANRQANAILGRNDLLGKRLLAELPEHFTANLFDAFAHVVRTGVPYRKDLHYEGDGVDRWFSTHAVRFEDGFMVTFTDITDRKRMQEVNAEADRIALTGQITRTVAHEVRNPLTNIHLAVEQLHDEVQDRDEHVLTFFQIIDRNLKRIGTLINQMLESSRKRELNPMTCKLQDILHNAMEHVADRLALHGMKGEVEAAGDLPEMLLDCDLIDLAITNIMVNAVEAMEPGKGLLRTSANRVGDEVLVEITDNGKGIRPEDLGRLFEPFYSGRPGGVGLGLTTSRSILNSHRIKLEVRSAMGEGTTFTLRIPSELFVADT